MSLQKLEKLANSAAKSKSFDDGKMMMSMMLIKIITMMRIVMLKIMIIVITMKMMVKMRKMMIITTTIMIMQEKMTNMVKMMNTLMVRM